MNKINPLYILGFFVLVLILTVVQNYSIQNKIAEAAEVVSSIKENGQKISTLKKHWKNSKQTLQHIEALLNQSPFKNKVVKKERKAGHYKVALHNLDAPLLDRFLGKILNEYVVLKKITIDRVSSTDISVALEIEL